MQRSFEELGVTVGGIDYGFFTGEAQFDGAGEVIAVDIEANALGAKDLHLDIKELFLERVELRRKLGAGFLEDAGHAVREHAKNGCYSRHCPKASRLFLKRTFATSCWRTVPPEERMPRDSGAALDDVCDEALRDYLEKKGQPVTRHEALKQSTKMIAANDRADRSKKALR